MKTPDKKPATQSIFDKMNTGASKWLLSIAVGVSTSLVTLVCMYFFITAGLNKAQNNLDACQNLLDGDNFFEAEQECEQAKEFLSTVKLVGQGKKEQLNREVSELLESERLQQGLLGNILVDGKFVSQPTKKLILAFKKAKTNGDIFFEQKNWWQAQTNYLRAIEVASKTAEIDQLLLAKADKQLSRTKFNLFIQNGEKSLVISDWKTAQAYFDEALSFAKKDSNILPEDMVQLKLFINTAQFQSFNQKGQEFFNKGNWNTALMNYEKALDFGHKVYSPQSNSLTGLLKNIARARIYISIEKGKKAFTDEQWDDAIGEYEKAAALLKENSAILDNTKESSDKLSRIMLQTTIIRDKQKVEKYLKSDQQEAALEILQAIQKAIADSPYGELPVFQVVNHDISRLIDVVRKEYLVARQTTYLIQNYQEIFAKHYPEARLSALSAPKIKSIVNIGNKLLFRMQCTEDNRGRPTRLQIDYLYSPETDEWQFYSE